METEKSDKTYVAISMEELVKLLDKEIDDTLKNYPAPSLGVSSTKWKMLLDAMEKQDFPQVLKAIVNLAGDFSLQDIEFSLRKEKINLFLGVMDQPAQLAEGVKVLLGDEPKKLLLWTIMRPPVYAYAELLSLNRRYSEHFENLKDAGVSVISDKELFKKNFTGQKF